MKRALYIGKFQPFHRGHLAVAQFIEQAPDIDEIVIAIGSSQWNFENKNPERPQLDNIFTWEERKSIIEASLKGRARKHVTIVPVLDFLPKWGPDSTPQWFRFIVDHTPQFHCLYTNREREQELFSQEGYEVRPHPTPYRFSATHIREKMATGGIWQPFVCPEAAKIIHGVGGAKRAAELFSRQDLDFDEYGDVAWEWRTFDDAARDELKKILALPVLRDEEILDYYLFSFVRTSVNFKLRKGGFKIKKLLKAVDGFEAWSSMECDFPVEREWFEEGCKEIKFPVPDGLPNHITEEEILKNVSRDQDPYVFLLPIRKLRHMRLLKDKDWQCGVEVVLGEVNGTTFVTVGLEGRRRDDVEAAFRRLGLDKYTPMNYMGFLEKAVWKEAGSVLKKGL